MLDGAPVSKSAPGAPGVCCCRAELSTPGVPVAPFPAGTAPGVLGFGSPPTVEMNVNVPVVGSIIRLVGELLMERASKALMPERVH